MTVTTTTTTNTYTGDGVTTAFSFTFEILETTDIKVIVVTTATGVESVRAIGTGSTNYAVTGTGNVNGGTVTFVTAPTASETVFLMRNMSFTQPTDYRTNDPFPAETHENALDRMALQIQQIGRRLDRALLRPESDTTSGALPHNIDLKGGVLKFNSSSGVPEADSSLTDVATSSANGLMSSSDKAKLDGIEASATTDQTASVILSAIKTVDGASSGLDADLLDGQQGSYYLDASNFSGLGTVATLNVGIGNNNIPKFTSGVADNDFLKVDGSVIEGRSASEVVSDLGVITADSTTTLTNKTIDASQLSGTVANARLDAQLQDVAGLAVTDGGFIVGDGSNFVLETGATVRTSLGLGTAATLDTGISNTNVPKFTSGVADNDFLKVDGTSIEGRSAAEVLSDIGGITASSTDTLTNKTIDASQLSGTVADARLPASISSDITGNAATATLASTTTVSDSTANTNFPVVFHDESNGLLDDTGALRYNPSTGELLVPKLTVAGTTTTVDTVTMNAANAIIFEGATADAHETTLTITDPTADRTITLPNATGTVLLADGDGSSLTNVNATTLDSVDSTSFLRSDAADTKTSGDLTFSDDVKATFGDSGDMQIFHDGSNSFVRETGTGGLFLVSNGSSVNINQHGGEAMAIFNANGAVELYHDNSKKVETTSSGTTITGILIADGVDVGDNEKLRLGADQDLQIYHNGNHSYIQDAGTGDLVLLTNQIAIRNAAQNADIIRGIEGGAVTLSHNGSARLITTSTGAKVTGGTGDGTLIIESDTDNSGESDNALLQLTQDGGLSVGEFGFDSSNALFIKNTLTGAVGNVQLMNGTEILAKGIGGGAFELYHDNSKKLETTSTGATITGTLVADGLDIARDTAASAEIGRAHIGNVGFSDFAGFSHVDSDATGSYALLQSSSGQTFINGASGQYIKNRINNSDIMTINASGVFIDIGELTLTSTDGGATENPTLDLYRNSASPADGDETGHITFSGENSAGEKIIYGEIESKTVDVTDGTEDGLIQFRVASGGSIGSSRLQLSGNSRTTFFGRDVQLGSGLNLIFEGATDDAHETTLTVIDPTSDNTISLPDSSGTVQVTSSSDRRLKKNIEPASSASQKIDDINVYQFDWIEDGKHEDFGVVAQEMQEVFPDCVAVQDPETGYLGIDYSKLVPVLLKEIKDLRARVADLENKDG